MAETSGGEDVEVEAVGLPDPELESVSVFLRDAHEYVVRSCLVRSLSLSQCAEQLIDAKPHSVHRNKFPT